MSYKNPNLVIETALLKPGKIIWRSPSNLALVKYWGKHGRQLPRNPSISFTLENSYTETTVEYGVKRNSKKEIDLDFFFEEQLNEAFGARTEKYLAGIVDIFPFLRQLKLKIHSRNSFPHSAGIASSASGMSALALCLCSLEHRLFDTLPKEGDFRKKASFVARLGSGSACRSVYPVMAFWGEYGGAENSSDLYAIPWEKDLHPIFKTFCNDILIVSRKEKKVSSSAGHSLMEDHPYANVRYQQVGGHLLWLLDALKAGDVREVGRIIESEALILHGLMMSSNPSFILMQPNTLEVLDRVRNFREETGHPLYFSLDAGPNPHLLYPEEEQEPIREFINEQLARFCVEGRIIFDKVGEGPVEL